MTFTEDLAPAAPASGETRVEGAIPAKALHDVPLQLSVELGRTTLPIREVLRLGKGAVIDLAKSVGDPVEVYANDTLIARGELVVVESALAVRLTEIVG